MNRIFYSLLVVTMDICSVTSVYLLKDHDYGIELRHKLSHFLFLCRVDGMRRYLSWSRLVPKRG